MNSNNEETCNAADKIQRFKTPIIKAFITDTSFDAANLGVQGQVGMASLASKHWSRASVTAWLLHKHGITIESISALLGHKDIKTTEIYGRT